MRYKKDLDKPPPITEARKNVDLDGNPIPKGDQEAISEYMYSYAFMILKDKFSDLDLNMALEYGRYYQFLSELEKDGRAELIISEHPLAKTNEKYKDDCIIGWKINEDKVDSETLNMIKESTSPLSSDFPPSNDDDEEFTI